MPRRKRVKYTNKLYTVCGTVRYQTFLKIQDRISGSVTMAQVVGDILERWAVRVPQAPIAGQGKFDFME